MGYQCYPLYRSRDSARARGKIEKNKYFEKQNSKPGWKIHIEQKIEVISKSIVYIDVILKCKNEETYTKHQLIIERLKKWYRRTSRENLESVRGELKHELTTYTSKLKKRRTVEQRDRINKEFSLNPKNVYRKFKTDENIEIKDTPSRDNVTSFWKGIWGNNKEYKTHAEWLPLLEKEYCKNAWQKEYSVTLELLTEILKRAANNRTPGRDQTVMYWIKKLTSCHPYMVNIMESLLKEQTQVPQWLSLTKTNLLPKNANTHEPENTDQLRSKTIYTKSIPLFLTTLLQTTAGKITSSALSRLRAKKARGVVRTSY